MGESDQGFGFEALEEPAAALAEFKRVFFAI
jgi:hypothetical protein